MLLAWIRAADAIISLAYLVIPMQIMHLGMSLQPKLVIECSRRLYIVKVCSHCALWIAAFVLTCGLGHLGRALVGIDDDWSLVVLMILHAATVSASIGCSWFLFVHANPLIIALAELEIHPVGQAKEAARRAAAMAQRQADAKLHESLRVKLLEERLEGKQEQILEVVANHKREMERLQASQAQGEKAFSDIVASLKMKIDGVQRRDDAEVRDLEMRKFVAGLHQLVGGIKGGVSSSAVDAFSWDVSRVMKAMFEVRTADDDTGESNLNLDSVSNDLKLVLASSPSFHRSATADLVDLLSQEMGGHICQKLDLRSILRLSQVSRGSRTSIGVIVMHHPALQNRLNQARIQRDVMLRERDFSVYERDEYESDEREPPSRSRLPGSMAARMRNREQEVEEQSLLRGQVDQQQNLSID
ncbi:MAG: hypothetical protein SGPRY_012531 [Prymnesium sp.]